MLQEIIHIFAWRGGGGGVALQKRGFRIITFYLFINLCLPNLCILTLYTYTNKNNTHGQMAGYTQQVTPITAVTFSKSDGKSNI